MALRDRLMRRAPAQAEPGAGENPQQAYPPASYPQGRPPTAGQVRRERRALVRAREDRIRDLGGVMLEMYKRDRLKPELLSEQCGEIVSIEERVQELDGALAAVTHRTVEDASRCTCGAPLVPGAHFCANCGRPVGDAPVVACVHCGTPLPAEATFCSNCGRPAEPAEGSQQSDQAAQAPTIAGQE
jgi:double zinc ribbon protein